MPTRTGSFPIGVRRGGSAWQKDLATLVRWVGNAGYEVLDLGTATPGDVEVVRAGGLEVGSVDLLEMGQLLQADAGKRGGLVDRNVAHVKVMTLVGIKAFFTVLIVDPPMTKAEGMKVAVEVLGPICAAAAEGGARVVVEGWPGPAPAYGALACTPETVRILARELGAGFGLNFDPSHLVRLGVPVWRFLEEFAPLVGHVHGKDTQIYPEAAYEYGVYQPGLERKPHGFGEQVWRYTIPGHGVVDWGRSFAQLKEAGYSGAVSVELEDENFNGTEAGEKEALVHSLNFLRSA